MSSISILKILEPTDLDSLQVIKQSYSMDFYFLSTVKEYVHR